MTDPAPYQKIANDLRDKILSGELAPGQPVPSEKSLAADYGVVRSTATRAIDQLRSEGLITTSQGARSRVRARPSLLYIATGENFRLQQSTGRPNDIAEAESQGYQGKNDLLAVEEVPAPDEIAERFEIEPGVPILVRRVLNHADGFPMKTVTGYYRAELAAGTPLAQNRLVAGGVARLLEDEDGLFRRTIARFDEDVEPRMPLPAEVEILRIPPGTSVARILRTLYDASGEVLEVLESVLPSDRWRAMRYKITVPSKL